VTTAVRPAAAPSAAAHRARVRGPRARRAREMPRRAREMPRRAREMPQFSFGKAIVGPPSSTLTFPAYATMAGVSGHALRQGLIAVGAVVLLLAVPAAAAPSGPSHWRLPPRLTWYWQLQGRIDNAHRVAAYDVDGFDASAAEVTRLHGLGRRVICYIDVGTWENWRGDAGQFPASVRGRPNGWPGERWLDIRRPIVRRLMARRFREQCRAKGFDALEPDNIDEYQADSGFNITATDQLAYNEWVARQAHALGLAVLQKNDPDQAAALEPYFDGVLAEQCNQYAECSSFRPYLAAGKPVLDAEYNLPPSRFCRQDGRLGIMAARYNLALDGRVFEPCW
jgi:hypothetical protein